jgi:hypothetical protein
VGISIPGLDELRIPPRAHGERRPKPVAHLDHATLLQSAVHAVAVPPSGRCEVFGYEALTSDGDAGC